MAQATLQDQIPADVEARLEEAVRAFRENHRHPANLALHAVGYLFAAKGMFRLFRGRTFSGLAHGGIALALLVAGHQIEGNEPFSAFRAFRSGNGSRGV